MVKVLNQYKTDNVALYHGDAVEILRGIPDNSIGYIVGSPPFRSLYTYSNSDRDMGNCRQDGVFHEHYGFALQECFRVLQPGRNMSIHCMDIPTSKERDGEIGLSDFSGDLIRECRKIGFIYHSPRVSIWKDPVTAMQRTKALGLLWKQLKKDSCMSRQGLPDYFVTLRKPGVNAHPVAHSPEEFPVAQWQQWASSCWNDIDMSDTLTRNEAREEADERHICALQLEVIRRGIRLWSNKGDTVLDEFGGIGSTPYVALQEGRKGIACELKDSYFSQMVLNCQRAEMEAKQKELF